MPLILEAFLLGAAACVVSAEVYEFSDDYIDKVNQEAATWTAGRNFPASMDTKFINSFMSSKAENPDLLKRAAGSAARQKRAASGLRAANLPDRFDAREHWPRCPSIGTVPDMSACNSAYIFAAVSAFADRLCIATNGTRQLPLSTEYVVGCCRNCRDEESQACSHGSVFKTWEFLAYRGTVTGGHDSNKVGCQPSTIQPCSHDGTAPGIPKCEKLAQPQPRCQTRCTNQNYKRAFLQDKAKVSKPYWLSTAEEDIMKEIMTYGPVTATFDLYTDFFHYKEGIYQHTERAKKFDNLHTAKLIGWGEEDGTLYWLLVNPWGAQWGDGGTVKILRGQFECGIEYCLAAARARL